MAEGFGKKLYRTADVVKYIFCMACRVRSPLLRDTLEMKCVAVKVSFNFSYATTHVTLY